MPDPIEPQNTINPNPQQDVPAEQLQANQPQPTDQQPTNQPPVAPKKHTGLIIGIVAVVVVVLIVAIVIGAAILIPMFNKKPSTTNSSTTTETTTSTSTESSSSTTPSGVQGTAADAQLQEDIIKNIAVAEQIRGNGSGSSEVEVVSVKQLDNSTTKHVEEWTVKVNGQQSVYTVTIVPTSDGGADFSVVRKK